MHVLIMIFALFVGISVGSSFGGSAGFWAFVIAFVAGVYAVGMATGGMAKVAQSVEETKQRRQRQHLDREDVIYAGHLLRLGGVVPQEVWQTLDREVAALKFSNTPREPAEARRQA